MGVFLNLYISPDQIQAEDWKRVYQETLILLDKFPFLDRVEDENGYRYERNTAHREKVARGYAGWETCGDILNGSNMEAFFLIEDIEYYRKTGGGVWSAKTQGMPGHIPLLAISCLICHRFPGAAEVSGDISASQCRRAVEWANMYLETPIDVPTEADFKRLLPSLRADGIKEDKILEAFFELTLQAHTADMGNFLRESLPPALLENHYRKALTKAWESSKPNICYLRDRMKDYLTLQLDFRTLCRLILNPAEGIGLEPRVFMEELLKMKLHVPVVEKECFDNAISHASRDDGDVDTVESLLYLAWAMMSGVSNQNVEAYLPLEEICADFESVLGAGNYMAMAQELLQEIKASAAYEKQESLYDGPDSRMKQARDKWEKLHSPAETEEYDISDLKEAVLYEEGNTISPQVHDSLVVLTSRLQELCTDEFMVGFSRGSEEKRKEWFHDHYSVLIPKEVEDMFFARIMDNDYIRRYVILYRLEVTSAIQDAVRALLWNPALLDRYWALAEEEKGRT